MPILEIEAEKVRAIYRSLPTYKEGQSFSDFVTSQSGKGVQYSPMRDAYLVTFENDSDAMLLQLDYLSMPEDAFWDRIHEEALARARSQSQMLFSM